MKELSIEEKAKRYDEAIKRAIEHSNKYCLDKIALEEIFPELKESEDEKIRKGLLYVIEHHPTLPTEEVEEFIAWLEKKADQKPDTDFSNIRIWKYIVDAVLTEKEGIGQYLDSPFTEEVAKKLQKRFGNIEQKPAWSEEDEHMFNTIANSLNREKVERVWNTTEEEVDNWLKSIKDRYTWKPNNEHYELEEFAKIVRGNLTGISKAVQKLFEAKYLQLTGNKMYRGFKD